MPSVSRVLMTADAQGGVWPYALELASEFGKHGIEVLFAVMGGITDAKRAEARMLPHLQLRVSNYKLEWMDSPWDDVARAGDWLLQLAAEFRPEIVHLNGYAHASLPWKTPVIAVAHSCVLSWFQAVRGHAAPPEWETYRKAVRAGLHSAGVVVAPSTAMLREIARLYGEPSHTRVIGNGRNPSAFHPGIKEPFILSAGRLWDDAKNIRLLAQIAPQLDWPVYLAGDSTNTFEGVHVLGVLNPREMAAQYSQASIYAHPALYEPFGLAVLEAALSGSALVLSDIPSLREIWGGAAIYADPRDPDQWVQPLNRLSRSPERRLSARARALQLTPASMAAQYLDVYQQAQRIQPCVSHSSVIRSAPTGITGTPIFSVA